MKKSLPNLNTRPRGMKKPLVRAILAKSGNVTGEAVRAAIETDPTEDEDEEPPIRAARDLLAALPSIDPAWIWWVLENRDREARQAAELSLGDATPAPGSKLAAAMDYLRGRYVYGTFRDAVWDRWAGDWISTRALSNAEAHQMPLDPRSDGQSRLEAFKMLREDEKASRVHNERFLPGAAEEVVELDGVSWLNTWTAPTVTPAPGDARPLLYHILYLCNGDTRHAAHVLDWLAFCYQNPGEKVNHALLMISEHQGVGKDTLALAMARLIGERNVAFIEDDAVGTGRNEFMERTQLVVVPEIMSGDRRDVANKLKPLITQPEVRIDEKNVKPYFVKNNANFVFFSNHENAAHIEDHDRRYFVIICDEKPRDQRYYEDLYAYIEGDAIAGFAWFLLHRDLSHFNPKAPAPHTDYKARVREATRAGWEAHLQDIWDSHDAPFDRDVVNLREALGVINETRGTPRMTVQNIAAFLKKVGGGDLKKPRIGPNGEQKRVHAVRDFHRLQAASLDVIALCYRQEKMTVARAELLVKNRANPDTKIRANP